MNKDCNGCFGASFNDCQRCQGADKVTPPKLDITPELAMAAYNTLIDYCKQFDSKAHCGNCIFNMVWRPGPDETVCDLNFYHICPTDWDRMNLPSLDGNTVTYIKDGQIKRITCARKEEARELFEEVKRGKKWSEVTSKEIIRLKHQQCSKCKYFSKGSETNTANGICDFITKEGHSRGCSPLDCKKKGIFKEKERKRRK